MHLYDKRKFTLLVACNSDFVVANVILNYYASGDFLLAWL